MTMSAAPSTGVRGVYRPAPESIQLVRVVDIDIKFGSLIVLFVKAALAAIPAMLVLGVIAFAIAIAFGAILGGIGLLVPN